MKLWPPQDYGVREAWSLLTKGRDVCLYAPTGGGKTRMGVEVSKNVLDLGGTMAFALNRKLLIPQTRDTYVAMGLRVGVRAAGHEDQYDAAAPVQILSTLSELSRAYKRKKWPELDVDLLVVDEGHIQRGGAMRRIIRDHKAKGGMVLTLSATPVGLAEFADEIVVSGTPDEYRECSAIVPAKCYCCEQPDLRKIERNATGEYVIDNKKRLIYTQTIVGNVIKNYEHHNPDRRPTVSYWPCKESSVWGCKYLRRRGHNWCHVDATDAIVDGVRKKLTRSLWEDIQGRFRDGEIHGLASRFKLREGIDFPSVFCCLLCTPIGSLPSYIQTVGRALRWSADTPDYVVVLDHGGNFHRHGDPNQEFPWKQWFRLSEYNISTYNEREIRERNATESIVCPHCHLERSGGWKCPGCGHRHEIGTRMVRMAGGELVEQTGKLIKPRYVRMKSDTQKLWDNLFHGHRVNVEKGRSKPQTFEQLRAFFARENHYWPPTDLANMPIYRHDWCLRMGELTREELRS